MKKNCISASFVAVFTQALPVIPPLDNKFCKDLFGLPYDTINGLTNEGYIIAIENKPMPSVTITPQKIVVKAQSVLNLATYVDSLAKEFKSKGIPMASSAYGINTEYQWLDLNSPSSEWMWNRFINPAMATATMNQCNKVSFRFVVNDSEAVNMEFMPRVGINDGIFASVNHHHAIGLNEFPTQGLLKVMFEDSQRLLEKIFFPTIIGE